MITFTKIDIEGFASIPKLEIPLNAYPIVWVKGSNGQGKTTFFSALVWGLYGKSLKGVSKVNTWDNLRPKDYSGTKVEIWFIKDNIVYKVIRCQKYTKEIDDGAKGRDRLLIYKEGNLLELKGKFSIQEELNKILGMSYMLFTNSVLFGQGLKRLIQESNADKRAIFEEIFNLSFLNTAKEIAKGRKDSMREGILDMEGDLNVLTDKLENYKELKRNLKIQEIKEKKDNVQELNQLHDRRLEYTAKLIKIQKEQKEEVMQTLPVKINHVKSQIDKYERIRKHYEENVDIPLVDLVEEIYKCLKNKAYAKALKYVIKLRKSFTGIHDSAEKLFQYRKRLSELREVETRYKELSMKGNWYAKRIAELDQSIKSFQKEKDSKPKLSEDYKEKISKIRKKIKPLKDKYESQLSEYKDYQWLLDDPLGNNGIKAFLFDSSIDLINSTLDKYAPILGFYIQFGVNMDSARKDFTTLISRGDTEVTYEELSGGEKQLVNIALAFAMNEVLTVSQGFNITFLDEVFESLSPDNIEIVAQLIRELYKDKTLFIITHQETLPMGNVKILQVTKSEGLSHYELL